MQTTVTARRSIPWIVAALSLFAAEVPAGSFQVNPIRVEMTKGATRAEKIWNNSRGKICQVL